jgi:hypothetical protein
MLREIMGKRRLPRLGQSENKAARRRVYVGPTGGAGITGRGGGFRDYVGPIPHLPNHHSLPRKHPVPSETLLAGKVQHDLGHYVPYGGVLSRVIGRRRRPPRYGGGPGIKT